MAEIKNLVLFVYTLLLFILHFYALGHIVHSQYNNEFKYKPIFWYLIIITALQYLDIVFSIFKLTKSNPIAVFVQ
uniref:Uncharacterized protein n=1 Tax=Caenorhabditis japonica TaxID=281687 RepID=A0A8R1IWN5_CAEJA